MQRISGGVTTRTQPWQCRGKKKIAKGVDQQEGRRHAARPCCEWPVAETPRDGHKRKAIFMEIVVDTDASPSQQWSFADAPGRDAASFFDSLVSLDVRIGSGNPPGPLRIRHDVVCSTRESTFKPSARSVPTERVRSTRVIFRWRV